MIAVLASQGVSLSVHQGLHGGQALVQAQAASHDISTVDEGVCDSCQWQRHSSRPVLGFVGLSHSQTIVLLSAMPPYRAPFSAPVIRIASRAPPV
ncbi:MAG: hypothetical protein ACXWP5_02930 [Bdellovibrionota bacterium]